MAGSDGGRIDERVASLLDELGKLTNDDAFEMAELWGEEDGAARRRAWQHAKASIERARLTAVLDRARTEVGDWMKAAPADFQGISGLMGREGEHVSARRAAAPALLDAVAGLLAERELDPADFELLTRPWRSATENAADQG